MVCKFFVNEESVFFYGSFGYRDVLEIPKVMFFPVNAYISFPAFGSFVPTNAFDS
jgi:hypothetical protein